MKSGSDPDFRYIGKKRRTKEDPRFVMGHGRFVADIALPGMKDALRQAQARMEQLIRTQSQFLSASSSLSTTI